MPCCNHCEISLTDENWSKSRQKRHNYICKSCEYEKNNIRYHSKKIQYLKSNKEVYIQIKLSVFAYYGNACVMCGANNTSILSLDHIDGNGRQQRKQVLKTDSGTGFYKWVSKNKPDNLRLLCYNCNCQVDMIKKALTINYSQSGVCKYCGQDGCRFRTCLECIKIEKRNYYIELKIKTFQYYGNCCAGCGETNISYLTIDHINNDGADHRRMIGTQIFPWLKKNNFPSNGFQILCFNCNYLKKSNNSS